MIPLFVDPPIDPRAFTIEVTTMTPIISTNHWEEALSVRRSDHHPNPLVPHLVLVETTSTVPLLETPLHPHLIVGEEKEMETQDHRRDLCQGRNLPSILRLGTM